MTLPGEAARFAAHLDDCPTCREAVDEQQWIDGLLRARIAQLETPPPAVCRILPQGGRPAPSNQTAAFG